jgi:hypothetical protein
MESNDTDPDRTEFRSSSTLAAKQPAAFLHPDRPAEPCFSHSKEVSTWNAFET